MSEEVIFDLKDINNRVLETLAPFVGKRLEWICYDEDSGSFYLMFEGLKAVAVSEVSPVVDGQKFAENYLSANLSKARQTLALQALIENGTAQSVLPLGGKLATCKDFVNALRQMPDGSAVAGIEADFADPILKSLDTTQPVTPLHHNPVIEVKPEGEPNGPIASQGGAENAPQT